MGSATAVLQTFQTDEWNANMYGAFSVVASVAVSVKNKTNTLQLAYSLHKCNKTLQNVFDDVRAAEEGKSKGKETGEPVTEQRAREAVSDLMRMYRSIENLYGRLRRAGLTNNSLTAGQLVKLRAHGETMLDYADWLDTSLNTEEVNAIFARASEEKDRGEIYDLEQVR